jgi:hypothetical protein
MSRVFPEGSAQAGAAAEAGILTNIPALGGGPVTEEMLD